MVQRHRARLDEMRRSVLPHVLAAMRGSDSLRYRIKMARLYQLARAKAAARAEMGGKI